MAAAAKVAGFILLVLVVILCDLVYVDISSRRVYVSNERRDSSDQLLDKVRIVMTVRSGRHGRARARERNEGEGLTITRIR